MTNFSKAHEIIPNEINDIEYDEISGTLNHARIQVPTQAEIDFREALIMHLRNSGISGDLGIQEYLALPLGKRGVDPTVRQQLKDIVKRYRGVKCIVRRPDLVLIRYGLVIEIDGSLHDNSNNRIHRDNTREAEYRLLGLECLVIQNHQIYHAHTRNLIVQEILKLIEKEKTHPDFKLRDQRRRTAISRARRDFKTTNSTLVNIGEFRRTGGQSVSFPDAVGVSQWGGYRFNPTHKKKAKMT